MIYFFAALLAMFSFLLGASQIFEVLIRMDPIFGGLIFLFLAGCLLYSMGRKPSEWDDEF